MTKYITEQATALSVLELIITAFTSSRVMLHVASAKRQTAIFSKSEIFWWPFYKQDMDWAKKHFRRKTFCWFSFLKQHFAMKCTFYFASSFIQKWSGSRTAGTSKMELLVIIVNGWKSLIIIAKCSILDVGAVLNPSLKSLIQNVIFYSSW